MSRAELEEHSFVLSPGCVTREVGSLFPSLRCDRSWRNRNDLVLACRIQAASQLVHQMAAWALFSRGPAWVQEHPRSQGVPGRMLREPRFLTSRCHRCHSGVLLTHSSVELIQAVGCF